MAKAKNKTQIPARKKYTQEETEAFKKARLSTLRATTLEALTDFVSKANTVELEALSALVSAKLAAGRDFEARMNNARALVLNSKEAVALMSALPIIDAVMVHSEADALKALRSGRPLEDIVKPYNSIRDQLTEASKRFLPIVDQACELGLVRDPNVVNEYRGRKTIEKEMAEFGIDPTLTNAHELLSQAKAKKKAEDEAERQRVAKEKADAKAANKAEEEKAQKANLALMKALSIDPEAANARDLLRDAKFEMKKHGIDPKSKDAVKDLLKKREETTVPA